MSRQHSLRSDALNRSTSPRALVVLLGWWGAEPRHLDKYADICRQLECITVQAIVDKMAVLLLDNASLDDCVAQWVTETAAVLRQLKLDYPGTKIPLILHAFSNGGALLIYRIEVLMETSARGNDDFQLVADHLAGHVFDSAPAFIAMDALAQAMKPVFPNKVLQLGVFCLLQFYFAAVQLVTMIQGTKMYRDLYWEHMIRSQHCTTQAYIYSESDTITAIHPLEDLIARRQEMSDRVVVKKYTDSMHVQHYWKHPGDYHNFVDSFLETTATTIRE